MFENPKEEIKNSLYPMQQVTRGRGYKVLDPWGLSQHPMYPWNIKMSKRMKCNVTSSGDLLIVMDSDDDKHTRVVRYSDTIQKQRIGFSEKEQPLFLSAGCKYITENRILDICLSDYYGHAVVVVKQAMKFRFSYTDGPSTTKGPISARGITTNNQIRILTADYFNQCIHILDQYGIFLRYIENGKSQRSLSLCVDTRDNPFVAVLLNRISQKKIQYYL